MNTNIDDLDKILIPTYMRGREPFQITVSGKLPMSGEHDPIFQINYTLFKKAVELYIQDRENRARIDELKHIDDPPNVRLYYYGLISVKDRLEQLERSK